jgi:hypothetical protein
VFLKIQAVINKIQELLDLHGDTWLGLFTLVVLMRIILVLSGYHALTTAEAATYSTAIAAFAYSNRGL